MTKQRREEAIEYIEGQLENGYVDLSSFDGGADAFEIVKEAINVLKFIDKWNGIGCTSFQMTAEELKEILEQDTPNNCVEKIVFPDDIEKLRKEAERVIMTPLYLL